MAVDIVMPQMGESIFEGTITKWLKKPGDKVERDEPLFEIFHRQGGRGDSIAVGGRAEGNQGRRRTDGADSDHCRGH